MNVYEFRVQVFVVAETAEEAKAHMMEEFDYLFGLDNQLQAAAYMDDGELLEELE